MARTFLGLIFIVAILAAVIFSSSPTGASTIQPVANPIGSAVNAPAAGVPHAPVADQQINDDLIVFYSACIGQDCTNGENFSFDTIRTKENNVRIRFQDTSNTASFPTNDWVLVANDSFNGGKNYFAIEDADAGRQPFRVEAGASSSALYVEADSDVGLGTEEPAQRLHVVDSDTPTIRLEQNNSAGWGEQTWDVGANEDYLFIRDKSSNTTPIQVAVGANDNTMLIDANGQIGVGTTTPTATLHIEGDLHVAGNFTQASDRNLKENIIEADNQKVLNQLLEIPIYYWNYTADADDTTHLGPMAQDFHAASQLGSNTTISSLDINGALIASVQALDAELEQKNAQIETLESENADLQERLAALEAAVAQILAVQAQAESEE